MSFLPIRAQDRNQTPRSTFKQEVINTGDWILIQARLDCRSRVWAECLTSRSLTSRDSSFEGLRKSFSLEKPLQVSANIWQLENGISVVETPKREVMLGFNSLLLPSIKWITTMELNSQREPSCKRVWAMQGFYLRSHVCN